MRRKSVPERGMVWALALSIWVSAAEAAPLTVSGPSGLPAPFPTRISNSVSSYNKAPTNLDLSSVSATLHARNTTPVSILVGGALSNGTVTGGAPLTINPGQLVTPAQYAAVFEILRGNQTLVLNTQGSAVGGVLNLNSSSVHNLGSLVVPKNVTVDAIGYNAARPLNVIGTVSDLGSIYALQNAPGISSVFNLGSLVVGSGALLSGNLPSGVNSVTGVYASAGMNLNVAGNVLNNGTISTPGTLAIQAGGSIAVQSLNNVQAVMAAQNINLLTGSGNIVNSGLISAMNSLNLNTINPTTDLIVNNKGGVLQATGALNPALGVLEGGTINVRSSGPNLESANAGFWGGELDAPGGINMFGKDTVAFVDRIVGPISNTGSEAHVSVTSGDLNLGEQVLSGDPSYYNNGNGGDIAIGSLTTVGGDLAILASGNITLAGATTISTTAANSSIFLGSGLSFDLGDGTNTPSFSPNAPGDTEHTLALTGLSDGGNIGTAGNNLTLTTTGAGKITLVAGNGGINMGSGTISAATGNVLIIEETGFTTGGTITTTGGSVTIASATPTGLTGTITNGTVSALPTIGAATNGAITSTSRITTSAGTADTAGGNITLSTAGAVTMKTAGVLTAKGNTTGSGGTINISAGSVELGAGVAANVSAIGGASGGPGGTVIISTSSSTTLVTGATSYAGNDVMGLIQANAGGGSAAGGKITVVNNSGGITYGTAGSVSAAGTGTGAGGNVGLYALGASSTLTLGGSLGTGGANGGLSNLAFISSGDITTSSAAAIGLNESSTQNNGGSLTMIAGASASYDQTTNTLTVNNTSSNSGSINLGAATGVNSIQTSSSSAGKTGGAFTAVAYGTGSVNLGGGATAWTLSSKAGSNTYASGNIVIVGNKGVNLGTSVLTALSSSGGTNGSGTITVASAVPSLSSSLSVINGSVTGGGPYTAGALTSGNVKTGAITTAGSAINVLSDSGNISSTSAAYVASANVAANPGGNITVATTGTLSMLVAGALTSVGNTSGSGGTINVSAGSVELGASAAATINANGGNAAKGGNVIISTNSSNPLNTGATSTGSGNDIRGLIQANAGGGNSTGGNITIVNNSGGITYSQTTASSVSAISTGTGAGGNVGLYALGGALTLRGSLGTGLANGGLTNLALISTADITTTSAAAIGLNESSSQNNGGALTLIAGANAVYAPGTNILTVDPSSSNNGSISLAGATGVSTIQTNSSSAGKSGGALTIVAFGTGSVNLGGGAAAWTLNTNAGSVAAASGNVVILGSGGVNLATTVTASINTLGGTSGTGTVNVAAASPVLSSTLSIVNGITSGGSFTAGAVSTGAVKGGAITTAASPITITSGSGGTILVGNVNGTAVMLSSTGAGTITQTAGTVTATSLTINTGTGNVGNLNIATPVISVSQSGSGSVTLTDSVALTSNSDLTTGTGGFSLTDSAAGGITTTGAINASGGTLKLINTTTAAPIVVGGALTGTTVTLTTAGAGGISGGGLITASSAVQMTSPTGTINLTNLATPSLTVTQTAAGVGKTTLVDSVALATNGASTIGTGGFSLTDTASGGIILTAAINAAGGTLSLINLTTDAPIAVGGALTGTTINLTTAGSGAISGASAITGTVEVQMTSPTGVINPTTLTTPKITTTQTPTEAGSVTLSDTQTITSTGASTAGTGGFSLTDKAAGGIITSGAITSGGALSLTNTVAAAPITIGAGGLSGTTVTLTTLGTGAINGTGTITTDAVQLTSPTGAINSKLATPSITITQTGGGAGSTTLTDSVAVTSITAPTIGTGGFSLTDTGGSITTGSDISAAGGTLKLIDSSAGASIIIGGALTGTTVTLTTAGSGGISGTSLITGTVAVVMTSPTGAINLPNLKTPSITTTQTPGLGGSITLTDTQAITSTGASTAGTFSLTDTAAGGIITSGAIDATGSTISLSNTLSAAPITVGAGGLKGTTVTLTTLGTGAINGTGVITADAVQLTSPTGVINSRLATPSITVTQTGGGAAGSTTLTDSVAVTSITAPTIGTGGFSLTDTGGSITTGSDISAAGGTLKLIDSYAGASINIGGALTGTTVTLTTAGNGGISGTSLITGTVAVVMTSPTGAINLSNLKTPSITTTQTPGGGGSITLTDTQAITSTGASTAGTFSLTDTAAGGIITSGAINATGSTISLSNTLSAAPITVGAGGLKGTTVTLTTVETGAINGTGVITATNAVQLTSPIGVINSSLATPSITVTQTGGGAGSTTLTDSVAVTSITAPTIGTGGFSLTDTGGSITTGTDISAAGGTLRLIDTSAGASINIGGALTGTTVTLTTAGIGGISGTSLITGTVAVVMTSPTGAINLSNLKTPSITVTQTALGAGSATLTDTLALTATGASTIGTGGFSLTDTAAGGIRITGAINAAGGPLSLINTVAAAPITVNAALTGTTVSLTTAGSGGISGASAITGTLAVQLTSPTGVVSLSALATPSITATQTGGVAGSVTLTDTVALTSNGPSVIGTGGFSLTDTNAGGIKTTAAINAAGATVQLINTIAAAPITVNGAITGTTITLTAAVTGAISGSGLITGTTVKMTSLTGAINLTNLATPVITVTQTGGGAGSTTLIDTVALTSITAPTIGTGGFSLTDTGGGITIGSAINASGGPLSLIDTFANAAIAINGALTGTTVSLTTAGTGGISSGAVAITGTVAVQLTSPAGVINLTNLVTPSITTTQTVSLGGSVTLTDTQAITSTGASTAGTGGFILRDTAAGGIATSGAIDATGGALSLINTVAAAPITVGGGLSGTTVTLTAVGAGAISGGGLITTTLVQMTSPTGAINLTNLATGSIAVTQTGGGAGSTTLTDTLAVTSIAAPTIGTGGFSLADTAAGGITTTGAIAATGGALALNNTAAGAPINVGTGGLSAGAVTLTTDGNITLSGNVIGTTTSGGTVNLTTTGTGIVTVNNGVSVTAGGTAPSILVQAYGIALNGTGTLNAANGTVTLAPNQSTPIQVGPEAGGNFAVTPEMMNAITAATLAVGSLSYGGGLTITGDLDVSGSVAGAPNFSLAFSNAGAYTAAGRTINLGSNSLTVNAGGTVNTGSINGSSSATSGTVSLTAGNTLTPGSNGLTIDGPINLYGTGTVNLAARNNTNIVTVVPASSKITVPGNASITQIAFSAGGTAYAIEPTTGYLDVISNGALSQQIHLPSGTPQQLAIDNAHGLVYVTLSGTNQVAVYNGTNVQYLTGTALSGGPKGIAVNQTGDKIFAVGNNNTVWMYTYNGGSSWTLASAQGTQLPGASGTCQIFADSTGNSMYVVNQVSQTVTILNASTGSIVSTLPVGSNPVFAAASTNYMYVADLLGHDLTIINAANQTVGSANGLTSIQLGGDGYLSPVAIATAPGFNFAYVLSSDTATSTSSIQVVNPGTQSVLYSFAPSTSNTPAGIALNPGGSFGYATYGTGGLYRFSTPPLVTAASVNLGAGTTGNVGYASQTGATIPIESKAGTLTINTTTTGSATIGNAYVDQSGSVNVGASAIGNSASNLFALTATGSIAVSGAVSGSQINFATNTLNPLTTLDMAAGGSIAAGSRLDLSALGPASITCSGGPLSTLSAPVINLFSGTGSIGSATDNMQITGNTTITANTSTQGAGSIYITHTGAGAVNLGASYAGGNFSFTNANAGSTTNIVGALTAASTMSLIDAGTTNVSAKLTANSIIWGSGSVNVVEIAGVSTLVLASDGKPPLSGTVTTTQTFAGYNPTAVAFDNVSSNGYVYTISSNGYLLKLDPTTGAQVGAALQVGVNPQGVATDGTSVYVTNAGSNTISVVPIASWQQSSVTSIPVSTGTIGGHSVANSQPWGIAVNPSIPGEVWVAFNGSSSVAKVNGSTVTEVACPTCDQYGGIQLFTPSNPLFNCGNCGHPKGIAFVNNGSSTFALVSDQFQKTVSQINTAGGPVVDIAVGDGPYGLSVLNNGSINAQVYVANISSNNVSVISNIGAAPSVTATINVGVNPLGVSVMDVGGGNTPMVFVTNQGSNTVSVINSSSNKVISTVSVGTLPASFGNFTSPKGYAYVVDKGTTNGAISLVDPGFTGGTATAPPPPAFPLIDPQLVVFGSAGATGNLGSPTSPLPISTNVLQINTSGDVYVQLFGPCTIQNSAGGNIFQVQSNSSVQTSGQLSAGAITISAAGAITGAPSSLLNAGTLSLTSSAGNIGAGTGSNSLFTATAALSANTPASVYINNTGALTLNASSAGGTFQLTNDSHVSTAGTVSGATVVLSTPWLTNNNTIQASGNLTVQNPSAALLLDGSGSITAGGTAAFAAAGSFQGVQSAVTGQITGYAASSFALTTAGDQTLNSITAAAGDLTLNSSTGSITLNTGSVLQSTGVLTLSGYAGVSFNNGILLSPEIIIQSEPQTPAGGSNANAATSGLFVPISFLELVPGNIPQTLRSSKNSTALIETSGDTRAYISKSDDSIMLEQGEILVSAIADTIVNAAGCSITVRRGTVALVGLDGGVLQVRNLCGNSARAMQICKGKFMSHLGAGEELVVSSAKAAAKPGVLRDNVGRRRIELNEIAGDKLMHSEFSFLTAVQSSNLLRQVIRSQDSENRALSSKMKKMAVCVMQVTAGHGSFSTMR